MSVTQLEASVGGMRARIEAQALAVARVAFVGAMAALPISTAATNFALAIGLIAWCFFGAVAKYFADRTQRTSGCDCINPVCAAVSECALVARADR